MPDSIDYQKTGKNLQEILVTLVAEISYREGKNEVVPRNRGYPLAKNV